jgi:hypothetical protein
MTPLKMKKPPVRKGKEVEGMKECEMLNAECRLRNRFNSEFAIHASAYFLSCLAGQVLKEHFKERL